MADFKRRRYIVRPDLPRNPDGTLAIVEIDENYVGPEGANTKLTLFTDGYMDGDRAPDGTDIGSRRKRRAYMRANGVADASDYTNHWQQAAKERAMGASHPREVQQRKADLIESMRKLEARRR